MHRRALLKGFLIAGVPAATAAAVKSRELLKQSADQSLEALRSQLDQLKTKFEQSDQRNRKLAKTALALAALSLGIDVTSVL